MQRSSSKTNQESVELNKIKTLIIDEQLDESSYFNDQIEGIEFTYCKTLSNAYNILENQIFDIALCNMNAPPASLKELFQKYNSVLPVVAFSSSNDPRLAYMAAKLKAQDFIYSKQLNYREITATLQKITSDWVDEQQRMMVDHFLQEPENRIILRELLVSDLPISQRIVSNCINEIQIDDSIKKAYGIKTNEILIKNPDILNRMVKMNVVIKEKIGQTLACLNCNSVNIYANFYCSNCNSSQFKRKDLFLHRPCNKIISVKIYSNSGEIFCNECMVHFENSSSNCYNILGFECIHCNKPFATPSTLYSCNECNYQKFDLNSAKWVDLYKFRIRDDYVNKLKSNFFSLMQIEDFLTQSGFTVKHYEHYIENQNSLGPFDLIAYSSMTTLIFITLGNDLTRDIEKILEIEKLPKTLTKKVKPFAIATSAPVKSIQNLLEKFNITPLIVDEDDNQIQNMLIKSFSPNIF